VRRAGLLHDIGRVAVPTGPWDLPRTLGQDERDRVRFHAWETERILRSTPLFGSAALISAAAHEHADGSGYHRGQVPSDIKTEATLLAAADMWCALRTDRPYPPALQHEAARDVMAEAAHTGHLDRAAADAVLAAAQLQPLAAAVDRPVGLPAALVQ
jgi:HD-GYP domain-containing protein (c-di-GMP phosphodiesterase class II)